MDFFLKKIQNPILYMHSFPSGARVSDM